MQMVQHTHTSQVQRLPSVRQTTRKECKMSEKEIQDWFDNGPIKQDTLELWLSIINHNK